ncbi:MAG: hypothetical protein RMJ98_09570 [Myxococcales bacterium]|nr:hypothetical protein [Myxococcales bacterium]
MKKLFTNCDVRTTKFELDGDEFDFYDALIRYVENQSIKAASAENVQANILSFQMAMLQPTRSSTSSARCCRRTHIREDVPRDVRQAPRRHGHLRSHREGHRPGALQAHHGIDARRLRTEEHAAANWYRPTRA